VWNSWGTKKKVLQKKCAAGKKQFAVKPKPKKKKKKCDLAKKIAQKKTGAANPQGTRPGGQQTPPGIACS